MYKLTNEKILENQQKSTVHYYMIGGTISLFFTCLMAFEIFIGYSNLIKIAHGLAFILSIIAVLILAVGTVVLYFFAFKYKNNICKTKSEIVKILRFSSKSLCLEYFDGHKKEIPYDELLSGKLTIKVGFANVLREADYKTMSEFFDKAYEYIQNVMRNSKKPKVYPVIHIIKGSDEDFLEFVIDPEIADIKALLEDWRKNMTEYYKTKYSPEGKRGEKVKIEGGDV